MWSLICRIKWGVEQCSQSGSKIAQTLHISALSPTWFLCLQVHIPSFWFISLTPCLETTNWQSLISWLCLLLRFSRYFQPVCFFFPHLLPPVHNKIGGFKIMSVRVIHLLSCDDISCLCWMWCDDKVKEANTENCTSKINEKTKEWMYWYFYTSIWYICIQ